MHTKVQAKTIHAHRERQRYIKTIHTRTHAQKDNTRTDIQTKTAHTHKHIQAQKNKPYRQKARQTTGRRADQAHADAQYSFFTLGKMPFYTWPSLANAQTLWGRTAVTKWLQKNTADDTVCKINKCRPEILCKM